MEKTGPFAYPEHQMAVTYRRIDELIPNNRKARRHSKKQLRKLEKSLKKFGFNGAILVDDHLNVLSGNAVLEAAKTIGMDPVPTIMAAKMSEADRRALILALNQLALLGDWDETILREELEFLVDLVST